MDAQFTTLGAIIGLVIAIVLIIKKVQPAAVNTPRFLIIYKD